MHTKFARLAFRISTMVGLGLMVSAIATSNGHPSSRLLTEREKSSIVGSQAVPGPCVQLYNLVCKNFKSDGSLTPCAQGAFPNCSGSGEGACDGLKTSWQCNAPPAPNVGNLQQCPTLTADPTDTCGFVTKGGVCYAKNGVCVYFQSTSTTTPCGHTNFEPLQGTISCNKAGG